MLRTRIGDIGLHVVDEGTGPPLVFVHGFPLDHTMWRRQIHTFRNEYRVIAPDLRGFGLSETSSGTVSMARFADDIAELLAVLRVDTPVTLCGLSMGGYIAWEMWRRHREQLGALILCDTRAAADTPEVARGREMMAQRVMLDGAQSVANIMLPKLVAAQTLREQPRLAEELHDTISKTSPVAIAATQRGMAIRQDFTASLPEIDIPALVLCGAEDSITPPDEMRSVAASLPRSEWALIPAAGHLAPMENPTSVNNALRRFLQPLR